MAAPAGPGDQAASTPTQSAADSNARTRRSVRNPVPVIRDHSPSSGRCPGQPTVTEGGPDDSASTGSPISSAIRMASSISVSTIWASGTVLMTSPFTKI